jgi:hypothetical protein
MRDHHRISDGPFFQRSGRVAGSLFYLARHHWKQPIENVFAVQALKLWSPSPAPRQKVVRGQEMGPDWRR